MSVHPSGLMKFEGYEVDRARWQLRYGDEVLSLNRKTFDLLLYLAEHADRVVTKDELLRVLWPEQFIEESNLTQQIFLLRKALARHAPQTRMIETVPGRGYRFAVPVHLEPSPDRQRGSPDGRDVAKLPSDPPAEASGGTVPSVSNPITGSGGDTQRQPIYSNGHLPAPVAKSSFRTRPFWAAAIALAALLTALVVLRPDSSAPVTISAYTQITHDGHAKSIGGTDGSRIYFTRLEKSSIAQISLSGKAEALMPLALQDPWSGAVSPDGSTLLIISQASGQGPATSLWSLDVVSGVLHRLANAVASTWSPDGERIAYASADGDLFLMRADGADVHRIASVGGNIRSIAWSPEGNTLRFSKDGLLWQITISGHELTQLLPGWGNSETQWSGDWSPSGAYFFVAEGQIWSMKNRSGLFGRKAADPVQLTYGPMVWDHPVPSRDGKIILASGRTRRGELVRFEPGSSQPETFLGGISADFVSYSRAANALAYVSFPDGILWRANVDGSNPVQLTGPGIYPKSICWSPDGSQLAFVDRSGERSSVVFLLASNGTAKPGPLIPGDTATESDPSWSPDGKHLIFSTAPNVGASARSELRIFDLASGQTTRVAGSDGLLVPRWSPDGRTVAAMTLDAKGLKLLNLGSGRWAPLDTGAVAFPQWSHDGVWIYFVRWTAHPALVRIRAVDGRQELLADLTGTGYTGAYTLWMGLDPADRPMMLRDAGTDDIYALSLRRR